MLKFFATDVSVSKGYDGSPALRFSESDVVSRVRYRVGKRVYDSRCENNHRYINLRVKASGDLCEWIRKMKLKEGSFINISGRYDEETIKDDETGKEKTYPIIILDDIKFCFTGSKKNGQSENEAPGDGYGTPPLPSMAVSAAHLPLLSRVVTVRLPWVLRMVAVCPRTVRRLPLLPCRDSLRARCLRTSPGSRISVG